VLGVLPFFAVQILYSLYRIWTLLGQHGRHEGAAARSLFLA
jgi:hypothetical protein